MANPNVSTVKNSPETSFGSAFNAAVKYTMDTLRISIAAATAFVMTGCNGNVEQKVPEMNIGHVKPAEDKGKKDGHHDEKSSALSEKVLAMLAQNNAALDEIDQIGVQAFYDKLHAKSPIAVEEKSAIKLRLRCVDERQAGNGEVYEESESHGIAGVGILAT